MELEGPARGLSEAGFPPNRPEHVCCDLVQLRHCIFDLLVAAPSRMLDLQSERPLHAAEIVSAATYLGTGARSRCRV